MRWIGAFQDATRQAFFDHSAERAAISLPSAIRAHNLTCQQCQAVYDECDEPDCRHDSDVIGLCLQCESELSAAQNFRQTA
jgi:hypothetical protein